MLLLSVVILATAAAVQAWPTDDVAPAMLQRLEPALPYVTVLKQLELVGDRLKEVLSSLPDETDLQDVTLHAYLPLAAVRAAADLLLLRPSLSPVTAYKRAVNRKLPLELQDPLGSSEKLLDELQKVEQALLPLLQLVRNQCYDVDEKSCNALVQVHLDRDPELARVGDLLDRVNLLGQLYLRLDDGLQLAAKSYGGLGYSLNRVDELSTLSDQLSQVLLAAEALLNPSADTTDLYYLPDELE